MRQVFGNNTWAAGQRGAFFPLTSASASIAVDLALSNNFSHTLMEDTTLAAPTNVVAGQSGVIEFTQDATARTLAFEAFWLTSGTITTSPGGKNLLSYHVDSTGTFAWCGWQ